MSEGEEWSFPESEESVRGNVMKVIHVRVSHQRAQHKDWAHNRVASLRSCILAAILPYSHNILPQILTIVLIHVQRKLPMTEAPTQSHTNMRLDISVQTKASPYIKSLFGTAFATEHTPSCYNETTDICLHVQMNSTKVQNPRRNS